MNPTARKRAAIKKWVIISLQGLLAIGALYFVFQNKERRREVAEAVRRASVTWMAAGVLTYGLVETLGGVRWVLLLRVQGFRLSWGRATTIFLIGLFMMTFTPGLIGGDAARVYLVIQEAPERKMAALMAVAMDRLMGLVSLILLAALVVACRYHWLAKTPATSWLEYVTLLILAGAAGVLLLSWLMSCLPRLAILDKYPVIGARLRNIQRTFRAYKQHWFLLIAALANTVAAHLLYFLTFYCAARALGAFGGPHRWRGMWDLFSVM
ncbi:MAG TPA: lysylphosphatidylglycerol synthase transmembrane domain-containing protein, partial [Chthoniobacteraceae bacterium]|nr:lysylphosphatidylglycerol synthase transmembrane domain-containing protein [Chthoniobacteraceae bacterium]